MSDFSFFYFYSLSHSSSSTYLLQHTRCGPGEIVIEDGTFEGAQDDGLNVHGTHLRVVGMGMRERGGLGLGGGLGGGGWWEGEGNPAGLISSSSSSSSSGSSSSSSSSSSSNNNNSSSSSNNTMLVVQFEHPETYGFVSLRPGDALQVLTYLLTYLLTY